MEQHSTYTISQPRTSVLRGGLVALALLGLAACDVPAPTSGPGPASQPAQIKRALNPPVGSRSVPPARAATIFEQACTTQRPSFKGTEAILAQYNFVQNTRTGTYFHPHDDLSVKLNSAGQCSMVFGSVSDGAAIGSAFAALSPRPTGGPSGAFNGRPYYNYRTR